MVNLAACILAHLFLSAVADGTSVTQLPANVPQTAAAAVGVVTPEGAVPQPAANASIAEDAQRLKNIAAANEAAAAANAAAVSAAVAAQAATAAAAQAAQQAKAVTSNRSAPAVQVVTDASPPQLQQVPAVLAGANSMPQPAAAAQPNPEPAHVTRFGTLVAGLTFAAVVKTLCMLSNVVVQLSPFPQVKRWEHRGDTAETDPAPYVSIAFGGWQWCYYGLFAYVWTQRSGFLILVQSNFLGAGLGTYYTYTFFKNCSNADMGAKLRRYLNGVAGVVFFQVCALASLPPERALFFTGLVSSFCSFLGAMSMLVTVPIVVETRSSKPIPGPIVFANCFSGFVWCLCGWILADPLVMGPNVVAVMASGICIYLKYIFPADDEPSSSKDVPDVEGQQLASKVTEYTGSKAVECTPLMCELKPVKPKSTIGPPKCEELLSEELADHSVPVVDCYGGTGGTW